MARTFRSFDDLANVLVTSRVGTPLKAAKMLSCAPSTVYRAIDRLEKDVGAPLFDRVATGWIPTELGRRIIRLAETVGAELAEAESFLLGRNKGFPAPLRVSASDGFAEGYLAPVLADFLRITKDLTIDLIVDNQFADLARREADIAIRPDQRPGEELIGRRAGKLGHALYGATQLLERHGMPGSDAELARFKGCALPPHLVHHTSATWWNAAARKHVDVSFTANTEMGLAAAISAGVGLGVLPCFLGDQLSGVRRVTTIAIGAPVDIWLVTHSGLRQNPVVRALIRALAAAMQRDARKLSGVRR